MSSYDVDPSTSRRAVLGGLAAGAGLLGADLLFPADVEAATLQGSLPRRVDCVVVGAGLSGLVAARTIAARGRSVLVVEARDRVGGRVLNHRLFNGSVIESGGAFIGPTQDRIAALAERLGVKSFPEYTQGNNVYVSSNPLIGRQPYPTIGDSNIPPDPLILPDAARLQTQLDQMASEIDVNAPWSHPKAKEWDSQTAAQWLQANTVNKQVLTLLDDWLEPAFGANAEQLSLLYVVWYLACSGDEQNKGTFERNSNTSGGAQAARFVGGSQQIPLRMAAALGRRVALNAPVSQITQRSGLVHVRTARGTVTAKRVIVACPPPMVLGIDWNPLLPAERAALMRHMHMGKLMKVDAVYQKPFWREAGYNGFGLNYTGPVRVSFDNAPSDGSVGVLLAFVGGATRAKYASLTLAARRTKMLEGFAQFFGDQALHPLEYVEHDWVHERWTGGGPVAVMGPGTLTTWGPSIRRPFGHVHWAGTETSTYWTGYMDGAVRAGERSGSEVLRLL